MQPEQVVVLDNGGCTCKAGIAGRQDPMYGNISASTDTLRVAQQQLGFAESSLTAQLAQRD